MMGPLLPDSIAPYAKAWVAFLGFVATSVVTAWDAAPQWLAVVATVLTAVGVYFVPNAEVED